MVYVINLFLSCMDMHLNLPSPGQLSRATELVPAVVLLQGAGQDQKKCFDEDIFEKYCLETKCVLNKNKKSKLRNTTPSGKPPIISPPAAPVPLRPLLVQTLCEKAGRGTDCSFHHYVKKHVEEHMCYWDR